MPKGHAGLESLFGSHGCGQEGSSVRSLSCATYLTMSRIICLARDSAGVSSESSASVADTTVALSVLAFEQQAGLESALAATAVVLVALLHGVSAVLAVDAAFFAHPPLEPQPLPAATSALDLQHAESLSLLADAAFALDLQHAAPSDFAATASEVFDLQQAAPLVVLATVALPFDLLHGALVIDAAAALIFESGQSEALASADAVAADFDLPQGDD